MHALSRAAVGQDKLACTDKTLGLGGRYAAGLLGSSFVSNLKRGFGDVLGRHHYKVSR